MRKAAITPSGPDGAAPTPGARNSSESPAGPLDRDRLYPGDCLDLLPRIDTGSVDLIFADPPFNIGYDYDVYDDARDNDAYLDWTRRWGREVVRALKPDGTFWLAIGDEYAAEMKVIFHRELGLTMRSWVVWYYTFGVHCRRKFARSHAHLFYFLKDPKRFTFNDEDVRVPSARQLVYADARANPKGRLPDDTWILRPQDMTTGFDPMEDTWYVPRVCGTFKERAGWHGCQMPEQLLGRIVRACSNPGETVLDPFAGSGTTLTVAKKLDRRFLGFELSPDYASAVERRLAAAHVGQPLEGGPEPLAGGRKTPTEPPARRKRAPAPKRAGA
ncbi:DNA-methyltransferase [Paludisphaera mucosa]|uniref:Methyltransferase n=1 Tax=Paludisphaera mucosa TaxID=3030827 RepID=A0ABT6FJG8_9BACT|nr:site-specific DNA-methyltransferase [Paludisphaera mucosa]MDG3007498.1 site-specific DNA-methyltransferase [Paludisphaera mucosa]